ncbi:DUF421 domain-containing protein [Anaerobacillus alkalidiazotrophicus]|uniref:DUF421 domain-containing protein n=1 Tax=Anaerobacillus alkalidiazotrophicus TaxID=472963 RepID=A0A1S2M8H8_9BACI|nr:DUF421 domain-containing protein [Anaerobacillus alkalidiazotrophicus]OIJ20820.1 DUF421 domain-containing protein [Anaerobacillus alkalidiazotrophicus]
MELLKELGILVLRIITIYPLLLFMTMMMGKRSIAQLPVFDFLVILTLGSVVGADLADPDISHIHTGVAVVIIGLFQIIVAKWKIKNRNFGKLITFEPTTVIYQGKFLVDNIRQIRYSIDNILLMLRENNIFDVSDVDLGIIEANGKLTVHKKNSKAAVTIEDLKVIKSSPGIAYPVIIEGQIYKDVLTKLNVTEDWLTNELNKLNIKDLDTIFYASLTSNHQLHVSLTEDAKIVKHPLIIN